MKNIHVLPTDKPSRLISAGNEFTLFKNLTIDKRCKHIYITNDKEIKVDEPYLGEDNNIYYLVTNVNFNGKKIILTTDPELIDNGVQAIDDEFLEWFVKNPRCESVEVEKEQYHTFVGMKKYPMIPNYKIIIPKEEPKQENCCTPIGQIKRYVDCKGCDRKPKQETLEEAADNWVRQPMIGTKRNSFIEGAKWQQERMYSVEQNIDEWFEKYKNK